MFDSIQLAMTGLIAFQRGLTTISNNVSNLNTSGFRGSGVEFVDVFVDDAVQSGQGQPGGVDSSRTLLDTRIGQQQETGRDLDLSLDGPGYFIVKDEEGRILYTRNGSFEFDLKTNDLVTRNGNLQVMGLTANGGLVPINIAALQTNSARPTTRVVLKNNLSPSDPDVTINGITVTDAAGGRHTVRVVLTKRAGTTADTNLVSWDISVVESGVTLASGSGPQFVASQLLQGSSPVSLKLAFPNAPSLDVSFDFGNVTGMAANTNMNTADPNARGSNIALDSADGTPMGTPSAEKFDSSGVLKLTYTNGQTVSGPALALAVVPDEQLAPIGNSLLRANDSADIQPRRAAEDLKVVPQTLEGSNVDLTTEFTKIILMQRGYQAASEVVSTANQMLQQLLDIRSAK